MMRRSFNPRFRATAVNNGQTRHVGSKIAPDEFARFDKLASERAVSNARLARELMVAAGRRPDLAVELILLTNAHKLKGLGVT